MIEKTLDDFIQLEKFYGQYCALQGYTRNDILSKRFGIPMKKLKLEGLQADMAIIDEFLTEEEDNGK